MDRMTYEEIRNFYFDCYLSYCRTKTRTAKIKGAQGLWAPREHELGYAINEFYSPNNGKSPIENLMSEVLSIILNGYRWPDIIEKHYSNIENLLNENDLKEMLEALPIEEKSMFVRDLTLLKVLPKE